MEGITLGQVVFGVVSLMMAVCSVLAVTSGRILRAATALLFVLFGTAGLISCWAIPIWERCSCRFMPEVSSCFMSSPSC